MNAIRRQSEFPGLPVLSLTITGHASAGSAGIRRYHVFSRLRVIVLAFLVLSPFFDAMAQSFDGNWSGTTSQGKSLSFTIAQNAATSITQAVTISTSCSSTDTITSTTTLNPSALTGNALSITVKSPPLTYTITGTFSGASASGTIAYSYSTNIFTTCTGSANVTWTATKPSSSVVLGSAGVSGVSAIISPGSDFIGRPANIWMGGVLNGRIYLRDGPSNWVEYQGGPYPVALTSAALPSSLSVSVVDFDISSLPGLDVYVGFGSTEADLSRSGHLAKVYTVPQPPSVAVPYTATVRNTSNTCGDPPTTSQLSGVLTPTAQAGKYQTTVYGITARLDVPGTTTVNVSYAEGSGTTNSNIQLTVDLQNRTISGSSSWTWTAGTGTYTCAGQDVITGNL